VQDIFQGNIFYKTIAPLWCASSAFLSCGECS